MKKKYRQQNQRNEAPYKSEEKAPQLQDLLESDVFKKLQAKKYELKQDEAKKREEAEKRIIEERKKREKNKSFEELLNESSLDWKSYK